MDDLDGGRKVVMVCRDGVTYWDALDADQATPLVIHPVMNPVEIGTMAEFAQKAPEAAHRVIAFLRRRLDQRVDNDPLYVMRVLWAVSQKLQESGNADPDDATLGWACAQAAIQQQTAVRMHGYAATFCEAA